VFKLYVFKVEKEILVCKVNIAKMSTLTLKSFSVDIKLDFRVDLLNSDLNNSTNTTSLNSKGKWVTLKNVPTKIF